jgi:putative flippase GtrA
MRNIIKEKGQLWGDLIRFSIAGALSVSTHYAILISLVEILHINPTFSSAAGFVGGCVVNYLLLYFWAFSSSARHYVALIRYVSVMSVSMGINVFIFWVFTEQVGIWYLISQFIATCCSSCFSFVANRHFTFIK